MKKLIIAAAAMTAFAAFAADDAKTTAPAEEKPAQTVEAEDTPIFSGFANYGIYSGYQLYGSIVNSDPVLQGYAELNAALLFGDANLGQLGAGVWCNSDLTGRRSASYRRAFNEIDPNIHWQRMFWLDDDNTWGIFYRTYVVWYYYPHTGANRPNTKTTFDWDHYLELANPYLIPYVNIVHEYEQTDGNLIQFGVKKPFQITDSFTLCPYLEFVWRNRNYGWCFTNFGNEVANGEKIDAGIATMKIELDATYMFTPNFGLFAKVAYCQNLDPNLRHEANELGSPRCSWGGEAYGRWNEFCWGGAGVCFSF